MYFSEVGSPPHHTSAEAQTKPYAVRSEKHRSISRVARFLWFFFCKNFALYLLENLFDSHQISYLIIKMAVFLVWQQVLKTYDWKLIFSTFFLSISILVCWFYYKVCLYQAKNSRSQQPILLEQKQRQNWNRLSFPDKTL